MTYLERAESITSGRQDHIRYKRLTLGRIRHWKRWHDPGKDMKKPWNYGEIMLAFEDGSVNFKQGGGRMQGTLEGPILAEWIEFLDGNREPWH